MDSKQMCPNKKSRGNTVCTTILLQGSSVFSTPRRCFFPFLYWKPFPCSYTYLLLPPSLLPEALSASPLLPQLLDSVIFSTAPSICQNPG